jgi:hypothetical protein
VLSNSAVAKSLVLSSRRLTVALTAVRVSS